MSQAPENNVIFLKNRYSEQHIELGVFFLSCLLMFLLMGAFQVFFFNVICEVWKISLQLPVKAMSPAQAPVSFKTFKLGTWNF